MAEKVKLSGAKNVRDLGGYLTDEGKIKEKKLLRGEALYKLSQRDVEKLINEYHLKYVIDLRTTQEKREKPDFYCDKIEYIDIPIFDTTTPGITHEKGVNNGLGSINMANLYKEIVTGEYLENISHVIKTIMTINDGSLLFHCTAGKDRTGVISAILLAILGVEDSKIYEDYLYTNKINKFKIISTYWGIKLSEGNEKKADRIRNIMLAKEEYLDGVFETIENDWNNFDNFVINGLKINQEMIGQFKKYILE